MHQKPMAARPLSANHFKSANQESTVSNPLAGKLASRLADAFAAALADFGTVPPRVTLDAVSEGNAPASEDDAWLRFESRQGSMTARIALDRTTVFAMCEMALGGTGTEEPASGTDRPLSGIEMDIRKSVISELAAAGAAALSHVLAMQVQQFENVEADDPLERDTPASAVNFRYLVNVFGYSGELRLSVSQQELVALLGTGGRSPGDDEAVAIQRDTLQRQIGNASSVFQVSLEPETVRVEDIVALKPGGLLKLAATMSTPVFISNGGIDVFSATLVHSVGRLAVRVIGPVQ